ncbi:E-beta-farnesene synthase, partial [Tanacetum coccineum]
LITDDIRGKQYYNAYLEKVAKHQRYLIGEEVSDPDSPAPKPTKATKPKASKQSKPLAPKAATKKPKLAPAKPREKKRKLLVDEFVDEGVPENEPRIGDEEADLQKAVEESLKEVHSARQGPHPPVVIREPESGKFQPLLEVQGKRKEKVRVEQAAQLLLNLQTPKKKSPADQYIFQRRTSTQAEPTGHDESSSLYVELGLTDNETDSDEEVPGIVARVQDEGQAGPNPGEVRLEEPASSAGTLSSLQNLNKELSFTDQFLVEKSQEDEPEKTNTESEVQSMVTVPIHQDTSSVPLMTTPVIDLTVSQPVSATIQASLPTSTATVTAITTTTTSLPPIPPQPQQGSSYLILIQRIGELEQYIADMVSKAVDEIVTDAVDWAIQAPLRDRFRDLPEADMKEILHHRMWESNSYQAHEDHKQLYEALEKSMARDHTDQLLTDLAEARKKKKKRHASPKTPPGSPPHQPPPPSPPAGSSGTPGASGASRASGLSQLPPPPPPPPSTHQSDQSTSTAAPSSSKTAASAEYTAWTTTDTRLKPSVLSIPEEIHMDDDTTPDEQVQSSGDEDIGHDHIPTASALTSTYAPPPENSLLAQTGDMTIFMDWFCKKQGITELKQQDLEGSAYELVKVFHPNVIHL